MTQALATGERLLVVDDEPDIAALVTFHLIKAGYRVSTASNGPDAIAQTYLALIDQHRSAWSWEIEVRPWVERF